MQFFFFFMYFFGFFRISLALFLLFDYNKAMDTTMNLLLENHFSKYLEDDLNLDFAPYFIGQEKCNPNKPVSTHENPKEYTFHLILSGTGYLVNRGQTKKLQANDVFFIPPKSELKHRKICYYPDKNDPWEYIWVNFVGVGTEKLAACAKLTETNNCYSIQNPTILRREWTEMMNIARNTAKRNASYYLPFIMKLFAEIADERKINNEIITDKEKKVKQIVDIIEQTYTNQHLSIKQIADELYYSTSYVSRIFKEVTNMTPIEYVTSLRMLRARDMLRSHSYNISQIAYAVGYNFPFYFSKEFKKYFGYPPSKFNE